MSARDACPSAATHERYLAQVLSDEEARAFEEHTDACPACEAALAELSKHSRVAEALRDAPAGLFEPSVDLAAEVRQRLEARPGSFARYELGDEIARGGMGTVLRAVDGDLGRTIAMKLLNDEEDLDEARAARHLGRFLEEAQVTSRLDHPGIVPVHELGLTPEGRLYFTMKLVRGSTLAEIFRQLAAGEGGWTPNRVLRIVLQVCEAMSYAHAKGVIHRDLKPDNIMVGRYGEVYVMDWGLARAIGNVDTRDLRIAEPSHRTEELKSDRRDLRSTDPSSPLYTLDGDVVGTPAFMSPEQALGRLDAMGPHSDVYAVGAMLYQLLSGAPPYHGPQSKLSGLAVWALVQAGPPAPLTRRAPDAPPELVAICERAMERGIDRRYPAMEELAQDLGAWMEGRVVHAYEAGALAELRKWVSRNRPLASAIAGLFVLLVVALSVTAWLRADAVDSRRLAEQRAQRVEELAMLGDATRLSDEAERLWPPSAALIPAYETWLSRARALLAGNDSGRGLDHLRGLLEVDEEPVAQDVVLAAAPPTERFTARIEQVVHHLERFADPRTGPIEGRSQAGGPGVQRRLEMIEASLAITESDEGRARWAEAIDTIREEYTGLVLGPQENLLPLGRDPDSGLYEFAHLLSGQVPERGDDGRLEYHEGCGVVLVLIPAGSFLMGAQDTDPDAPGYDRMAGVPEGPPHEVRVEPFFLSKFELTQAQWQRWTGANPSGFPAGTPVLSITLLHPVEQVSWTDCMPLLSQMGLTLPTEEQWEYAARAHTSTPWWMGFRTELNQTCNVGGSSERSAGLKHLPVNSLEANPFGLHHIIGNVSEMCADRFRLPDAPYGMPAGVPDDWDGPFWCPRRGGAYDSKLADSRCTRRFFVPAQAFWYTAGVRPSRGIDAAGG